MRYAVLLGELTFPIAPAAITVVQKSRNRTVNLIDGTQRILPKTPALREFRMELLLPRVEYPFAHYPTGFVPPEVFLDGVREYALGSDPVTLTIRRGTKSETCAVFIGDASVRERAEEGEDVVLTLTLVESDRSPAPRATADRVTVREGDTLRLIARRVWGDESRWNYLYSFNLEVIEGAAKAAGYSDSRFGERLIPGITLVLPREVDGNGWTK